MSGGAIDRWLLSQLACPRDRAPLEESADRLRCRHGHVYPIVDGVPIMLLDDVDQTFYAAGASLARAGGVADRRAPDLHLESLGVSEDEKQGILQLATANPPIDPVVAYLVAATNGLMYRHLVGRLTTYPIPDIGLPPGHGELLLDLGCSWGRWSLAAAARGYRPIGIDPSLGAVMAARRVAQQLGADAHYVVGDARHLPFADAQFDRVFSYSVLQHFSRPEAARAVAEIGRTLKAAGESRVQMPTRFGVRCLYHQLRRRFRDGTGFDVRYWSLAALRQLFTHHVGPTRFAVDCFFGIGLQPADAALMTPARRLVLNASSALKSASTVIRPLVRIADSVIVQSVKPA